MLDFSKSYTIVLHKLESGTKIFH